MKFLDNILSSVKEALRDKQFDLNQPLSYRTEEGDIVENYKDQEHIQAVNSTAIESVKYDPKTKEAKVTFKGGDKVYSFPDVPLSVIKNWKKAPSKGRYYHRHVRPYSTSLRRARR